MKMKTRKSKALVRAVQASIMAASLGAFLPLAMALPQGGISNTATAAVDGARMDITGSATNNVIAWDSFSIDKGETVNFTNTNNYLNYVVGNNMSEIYGTMSGGGQVYLINPNGILFGEGAQINVGSLYASTRQLSDNDFNSFNTSGVLSNDSISVYGDIVNRSGSNLGNMKITLEGDTVTFAKSNYNSGTNTISVGNGGDYTVNAYTAVNVGYNKNAVSAPTAETTKSNFKLTTVVRGVEPTLNYCELIDNFNGIKTDGQYMLSDNVVRSASDVSLNPNTNLDNSSDYLHFHGVLDGAGHTVTLNGNSLFSYLGAAQVYNLNLAGTVSGTGTVSDPGTGISGALGALANHAYGSTISSVVSNANISYSNSTDGSIGKAYVGGLVGLVQYDSTKFPGTGADATTYIKNSVNKGTVTVEGKTNENAIFTGGIVGSGENTSLYNVHNEGVVSKGTYSGGLLGNAGSNSRTERSYNTGAVSGEKAGGLAGTADSEAQLSRVFNTGSVTGTNKAGGIIGEGDTKIEVAYNSGDVTAPKGHAFSEGNEIKKMYSYNSGKINGSTIYSYYDNSGAFHNNATIADINNAFLTYGDWYTGYKETGRLPLLSTFMSKLYMPADVTVEYDGKEHVLFNLLGESKHLLGTIMNKGTEAGEYKSNLYSDQFGYMIDRVNPILTITSPAPAPAPEPDPGDDTQKAMEAYYGVNGATYINGTNTDDINGDPALADGGNKAAIDMAHDVHKVNLSEEQIIQMTAGDKDVTISSNKAGTVEEHIEISDSNDGENP